jgi:preprotein translocase subunit SecB
VSEAPEAPPTFSVRRIYLKDSSLESPRAPSIFTSDWSPRVHVDLDTRSERVEAGVYEVVLTVTVRASGPEGKTGYIVEVHQAGLFEVKGLEGEALEHMLRTVCPGILFSYAREAVDNLLMKATFRPLMLAPVNFETLYAEAKAKAAAPPAGKPPTTRH